MNYRGFNISFLYINKSGGAPRGEKKKEGRLIVSGKLLPNTHIYAFFSL